MAIVQKDQEPDSIIGNFETDASCLLPYDLVSKIKSIGHKSNHDDASETLSYLESSSSSVVPKLSIVKTRVHFRCYIRNDFNKISEEQK